jgi:hypothetical protein
VVGRSGGDGEGEGVVAEGKVAGIRMGGGGVGRCRGGTMN